MSASLDMDRIAKALGAERCGKVVAGGGYFGAVQLAAEVAALLLEQAVQSVAGDE